MGACTVCRRMLPIASFPLRNRRSTRRQSYCSACKAVYQQAWYRSNRERHLADVRRLRARYVARNRRAVAAAKAVPCTDCGVSYAGYLMDFDHVRGRKRDIISRMVVQPATLWDLLVEIAKCDVVCANCHRERTYRRGWPRRGLPRSPEQRHRGAGQLPLVFEECEARPGADGT